MYPEPLQRVFTEFPLLVDAKNHLKAKDALTVCVSSCTCTIY